MSTNQLYIHGRIRMSDFVSGTTDPGMLHVKMHGRNIRIDGHDTWGSEGSIAIPVNFSFFQIPPDFLLRIPEQGPVVHLDLQIRDRRMDAVLVAEN